MKVFKRYTFDEVKAALQEWLAPEEESEGEIIKEPAVAFDSDAKEKSNYSLDTSAKKSKEEKFDDLFSDNKEEESDDLPF
jgi:hypothetical protein